MSCTTSTPCEIWRGSRYAHELEVTSGCCLPLAPWPDRGLWFLHSQGSFLFRWHRYCPDLT